ncbi:Crp/Fnr family transcriptional regulator [Solitalea sp. MAHUQ-68]|uniref:Crp/Fnr family transcriptional regulator n=1 Tax=Solitalea agri TaxID=2953739 RepID=A0A9X2JB36_9SPHI|nr:Crp/Fnr family transcriptional regulator [Solitalea agri]MCO4292072.1 Crp/Fnr family transcriptional regulator [Solitalea agri]
MITHSNCFLCKHTLPEWHTAIESNSQLINFKKGEVIFKEGDTVNGYYFIHSGKVKVHKQWGSDKELIIKFAAEGDVLGHRAIGNNQHYPVSATAIEPVSVCFISTTFFQTSLKVNNELTYQMMLFYAKELQDAELSMRNMVHMDVKSRIVDALLKIKSLFGVTNEGFINTVLSRQDIASYAGTTYETLFKVLNELVKDQFIRLDGKNILIINDARLKDMIRTRE